MVSNLYSAQKFFKLQDEGKVARNMGLSSKLRLDGKGFYLNKKGRDGTVFRQRVGKNDRVYARSSEQGVTKYSEKRDSAKTDVGHSKSTPKTHNPKAHLDDRKALSSNRIYNK